MDNNRVALVTGGSRGLGASVALALGRRGFSVVINCVRQLKRASVLAEGIGNGSFAFRADVSDPGQVKALVERVKSRFGRLDVLVNNAGITRDAMLARLGAGDWDMVLKVNLKGCFNTIKAFAPLIANAGGGHIVNISSRAGLVGNEGQAAYSASKAAVCGLTYSAAKELGGDGIMVNAVMPGYMPTDMGTKAEAAMGRARTRSLLGRLSDPEEAANFIAWLSATRGITGQAFVLDSRPPEGLTC